MAQCQGTRTTNAPDSSMRVVVDITSANASAAVPLIK